MKGRRNLRLGRGGCSAQACGEPAAGGRALDKGWGAVESRQVRLCTPGCHPRLPYTTHNV